MNEELRAHGPREAEPFTALDGRQPARSLLVRLAVWIAGALVLLGLKWGVEFLPPWVQIVAGIFVLGHLLSLFVRSTRPSSAGGATMLRALFLVWFAICVALTVLVAIGGFQQDDRALLGVVWPVLGLIWVAYRLRRATLASRAGAGREPLSLSDDA